MEKQDYKINDCNIVSYAELQDILNTNLDAIEKNPADSREIPPMMLRGAPGVGKSTIIREIAEQRGIGFIDIRLATMEPIDLRGLPVPDMENKVVDWFITSILPRDPDSKGIILFDELTAADRMLQVAAYELILDRRLGKLYKLPDGWYVVGAGNRIEDKAVATVMSSALANRFMHFEIEPDYKAWLQWAAAKSVNPAVTGYINFKPNYLFNQAGENLDRGWPSPRSWERVSKMCDLYKDADRAVLRKIVYGLVGDRAGLEFMEFYANAVDIGNVENMMLGKDPIKIPDRADKKYAFCSAMVYNLWRDISDDKKLALKLEGFYNILMELSPDFATMSMKLAQAGSKNVPEASACKLLRKHPSFMEFIKKFQSIKQVDIDSIAEENRGAA